MAFIDENLKETARDTSSNIYAMASCKYSKITRWTGAGAMPGAEKRQLLEYVAQAHQNGKRVRLWASPENETVWRELLNCGVDLINTDKLALLKNFLLTNTTVYANAYKAR